MAAIPTTRRSATITAHPNVDIVGIGTTVPGGTIVVGSLAASLVVLLSPPPETVAELVTLAGAVLDTFTVSVSAG